MGSLCGLVPSIPLPHCIMSLCMEPGHPNFVFCCYRLLCVLWGTKLCMCKVICKLTYYFPINLFKYMSYDIAFSEMTSHVCIGIV